MNANYASELKIKSTTVTLQRLRTNQGFAVVTVTPVGLRIMRVMTPVTVEFLP